MYDRPTWHYQLAATLTYGDDINVPPQPGPLPAEANLQTQELHIAQAIALCRRVMSDSRQPAADRAIAACWLAHLTGDAHQPCHAGSLYASVAFPDGDRGGNEIKLLNGRNLHALWDGLLGPRFDEGDTDRRLTEIITDEDLIELGDISFEEVDPLLWLAESREVVRMVVYTAEVVAPVRAVSGGKASQLPPIRLSQEYLKAAGVVATLRADEAGYRLAAVWRKCLRTADESPAAEGR
ncbi:S1/P1 Nuclease [Botrimarina colliarenosi]|uniref:S1/P1 Nuclease n=1 Tax=Botrimarina colliarenosi TaxID=2528001 RepID=A0A5C6AE09_9BACT|nr:S1/P1 nuclease [Botrimarina colliarenosi]TWT98204.1 S1/P1 Nuclease [Botrimarina colliarenosi]